VEYFLGSLMTLITVAVINKLIRSQLSKNKAPRIRYSQSHVYSLVQPLVEREFGLPPIKKTQATSYQEAQFVRVMVVDGEAYWIKDNKLFVAQFVDGEVDKNTTSEVDTMSMDKLQLEKTMFVVEKLTEGFSNDTGNTGKPKF
jgi:hypothetical protein